MANGWTRLEDETEITELLSNGVIHECNRLILHPLGLALCVEIGDDGKHSVYVVKTDDPEGIHFAPEVLSHEKALKFKALLMGRFRTRWGTLNYGIQPLGDDTVHLDMGDMRHLKTSASKPFDDTKLPEDDCG